MNKGIIITLPRWDNVTEYLSQFSEQIIKEADDRGVKYKVLEGKEANKVDFEKVIDKLNYNFIVFNGHGSPTSIKGHKNEVIIEMGNNEDLLKGRIIYARACEAGAALGKSCVEKDSNGCFIGYDFPFVFWADKTWDSVPQKDETARLFLEPSNMVPITLIKGHTTREAHKNSRLHILKNLKKEIKKNTKDTPLIVEGLLNNYYGQVLLGNENAFLGN